MLLCVDFIDMLDSKIYKSQMVGFIACWLCFCREGMGKAKGGASALNLGKELWLLSMFWGWLPVSVVGRIELYV